MKRLIKKSESNQENSIENDTTIINAQTVLNRIDEASNNLKDVYYVLFDNLNALFETYPNLYKQMQMTVKLPTNDDAIDVVKFHDGLHQVLEHFKDPLYLKTYINPSNDV